MGPRVLTVAGTLCVLVATLAQGQDFRKVTWGMSPAQVIAAETAVQFSRLDGTSGTILSSRVSVMGFSGILNYIFAADRLVTAQYRFDDEPDMRTFAEVLSVLTGKYGPPFDSGDVYSVWASDRTFIRLSFKDSICRVDYADKAWIADQKEKRRAEYDSLF